MTETTRRWVLAARPEGPPAAEHFRLEDAPMPEPGEGEALVRVLWLSVDPYMRGRMSPGPSYVEPFAVDAPIEGGAVGEVVATRCGIPEGALVLGSLPWAGHAVAPEGALRVIDPAVAPPQTFLGALGMPGFTGWHGLTAIGRPLEGETLVVGAATGPVGSMVGQLAKARGLRAVGVAGGPEKCALAVEEMGLDACLDRRAHDARSLRAALSEACPEGVDVYFENVGGDTLAAVLPLMNVRGRIPVCGMIAWYDGAPEGGRDRLPAAWRQILVRRLHVEGFIISDHWDRLPEFLGEVGPMVADGRVRVREDVAEGLDAAPGAFMAMLRGDNLGKQLVRLE